MQTVSQNEAFAAVELLLLQQKKTSMAADRTIIDLKCIVGFYIPKNRLNDENS